MSKAAEKKVEDAKIAKLGLPALVGTEKQVAWANSIRLNMAHNCGFTGLVEGYTVTDIKNYLASPNVPSEHAEYLNKVVILLSETSAKWYIECNYKFNK